MVATASINTIRKDLLTAPRKLRVIQWPYSVPLITSLHNPATGALVIPDNGFVIGSHRKQRGGELANAQTLNDVMIHGEGTPAMQIPTERRITLGLEPLELHRINLENYWGADWSGVQTDASGGVTLPVPSLPINKLSRIALVGVHDYNGLPCYLVWLANRVNVSETGTQALTDSDAIPFPYTMNFQGVDELDGEPMIIDIFGPGWNAMNAVADTGFYMPLTGITVTPATATLTAAAGAGHDIQLSVIDSNGRDRTDDATYESWDPTKAVVTSHGVVVAVAVTGSNAAEVQTVTVNGTPTGGTFTLTFDGQTTTPLPFDATSTAVQTALRALSSIGGTNVTVAGSAGGPYTVTFASALVNMNVPQITANGAALTGGTAPSVSVVTATPGAGTARIKVSLQGNVDDCVVTVS